MPKHPKQRGLTALVSVVERAPAMDPLDCLENVARAAKADPALASQARYRSYWARPADEFAIAGFGAAVAFAPTGNDRFETADRDWSTLIANARIHDPSGGARGAGPLLMGGFAFDPTVPATSQWHDFPDATLVVPRLQYARDGGTAWLTTTLLVDEYGEPDCDAELLPRLRGALLDTPDINVEETSDTRALSHELTFTDVRTASEWCSSVRDAIACIRAGDMEKVVLAREVRATAAIDIDVGATLRQLLTAYPNCYIFGFWNADSAFVGATPERLVSVEGRVVHASSLAGSAPRGESPEHDAVNAARLLASEKDRGEHEIVRRALCAGLTLACDDVTAAEEPTLMSLPQVHHLHTAVHARLRDGHTALRLAGELHPTPAVGGEPREAAMDFIREHEHMDRGWYAAPVGWVQRDRGELAVALRCALINGSRASLFAGCGIVADSDPEQEYQESLLKLQPMKQALAPAIPPTDVAHSADRSATEA